MNKETLDTAIQLGQLIKLLTPLGTSSKSFDKRLGRVRSAIHEQLILAVAAADKDVALRAQRCIAELAGAVRVAIEGHLDVPELLKRARTEREVLAKHVFRNVGRNGHENALFDKVDAIGLEPGAGTTISQADRARVIHAFTSAVNNSTWLTTLLALKLSLSLAGTENEHLVKKHGSSQGRDALPETLRQLNADLRNLTPADVTLPAAAAVRAKRVKKGAVKAAGIFTTQVTISVEALLAQPEIAALATITFKGVEPAPTLAQLLEQATTPHIVTAGEAPETVAQRIVDELVAALVAREKASNDERAILRQKTAQATRQSAAEALQRLDPKLLKALQRNPDLLNAA